MTQSTRSTSFIHKFEKALKDYYADGHAKEGTPSIRYFAELFNLTPGYFSDLLKKETGKTAHEILSFYIIEVAKRSLADTDDDISSIAYSLGFPYSQHFTRTFRRITGLSPSQFRDKIRSDSSMLN